MKKISIFVLILLCLAFCTALPFDLSPRVDATPVYIYGSETLVRNQSLYDTQYWFINDFHPIVGLLKYSAQGDEFRPVNGNYSLTKVSVRLKNTGSPTANVSANIYHSVAHKPSGSVLAISTPINSTAFSLTAATYNFTFDGAFILQNNTWYCWEIQADNTGGVIDGSNYVQPQTKGSDVFEGDRSAYYGGTGGGASWQSSSSYDLFFEIYGKLQSLKTDWDTFQFSPARFGCTDGVDVSHIVDYWTFKTGAEIIAAPTLDPVNGIVYIGSLDDQVYALNMSTGSLLWNYTTGGQIYENAALSNGTLYVSANDLKLYALNAATGSLLWSVSYGGRKSPTVDNGVVYVAGTFNKLVFAFNASTGVQIWNYTATVDTSGFAGSPTVAGSSLFVQAVNGTMFALNVTTGLQIWNYSLGWVSFESAAYSSGVVYATNEDAELYALDSSTGTKLWNYSFGFMSHSTPAIVGDILYLGIMAGGANGYIKALNTTSQTVLWTSPIFYTVSSEAVSNGIVYIGSGDGSIGAENRNYVYAFNATTGSQLWNYSTGTCISTPLSLPDTPLTSPAVSNGVVFIGSLDGNLYALSGSIFGFHNVTVNVSSTPEINAAFSESYSGSSTTTPAVLNLSLAGGLANFTVSTLTYSPNSSYQWTFDYWVVNSTDIYSSSNLPLTLTADTTLSIVYSGSGVPTPFPFTYPHDALNMTWYFRSDTWTVLSHLGYKLQDRNTNTATSDTRISTSVEDVTYGFRVWVYDYLNNTEELTSGTPAGLITLTTNTSGMQTAYWNCPSSAAPVSAVEICVYQKFDDEAWTLRRIFISKDDLLWKFPAATWTFHFWLNRTEGSTYSTMAHGSYTTYNSRVDIQYYKADPWETALARLYQQNFLGFLMTPWTYWLGDVFYGMIVLFVVVTSIMWHGSMKLILAELWILGGAGSVMWAMIPPIGLHLAVLLLAIAMGWTFMRLVYGRRS